MLICKSQKNSFVFKSPALLDVVHLHAARRKRLFSFSSATNPLCSLSSHNRRRRCFGPTCSSFCSCRLSSLNQDTPYIRYTGMCSAVFTLLKTTEAARGRFALGSASAHQFVYQTRRNLHYQSNVWTHPSNWISFLSFCWLMPLQCLTEGIKTTIEHTWDWDYIGIYKLCNVGNRCPQVHLH